MSALLNLFKMPKMPAMPAIREPAPQPQIDEASAKWGEYNNMLRRRGMATQILTSDAGLPNLGAVAKAMAGGR